MRRSTGRATAVRPGDRRDGEPLIFGWGSHLTRAEKQRYRERFVLWAGIFIVLVIALVIGIGALQQYYFKPRTAVASVNGASIERQWYDKNVAYTRFVVQHEIQDLQSQYQALIANQRANAQATATANPQPSGTAPAATAVPPTATEQASPSTAGSPAASGEPNGTPTSGASPTATFTPAPTLNPQESATVEVLSRQFASDQTQLQGIEQQTVQDLIDAEVMRQNASKLGISISQDEVAAQAKQVSDRLGGTAQLFQAAHLSQDDFNRIQYNAVLKDKFQAYFAGHPEQAPTPSPTPLPTSTPTAQAAVGPVPPTPTATPTPVPTPGADALQRWLIGQEQTSRITRAPFPLPPD